MDMKSGFQRLRAAKHLILMVGWVCSCHPVFALNQHYGANLAESTWSVAVSDIECLLIHNIPRYGRAIFWQSPGRKLQFALQVIEPPVQHFQSTVRSVPPSWKHGTAIRTLGKFSVVKGETPIHWGHRLALRVYYELENGMFPQFNYADWVDGLDDVSVVISAVGFREVLPQFGICTKALARWMMTEGAPPPLAWDPDKASQLDLTSEMLLYFATDSHELTPATRLTLSRLAAFLNTDGNRQMNVLVSGHADQRGSHKYNDRLSQRRAKAVMDFLISLGIPLQRIQTKHFGERQLVVKEENEAAWARNRRALVTLGAFSNIK